jgi:periplasmic mercuric ion binding protein
MKRFALIIFVLLIGGMASESFAQKKDRAVVCFQSDMDCVNCEKTLYEHLKF